MNQEEKIKAYLLNQLPPDETISFRVEIENDPELMAEVKVMKFILIAKELKYREQLKENMQLWKETSPVQSDYEKTWIKRNFVLLLGSIIFVLLIGFFAYKCIIYKGNTNPVQIPVDTTSANNLRIYSGAPDTLGKTNYYPIFSTKRLQKFSNAILSINIRNKINIVKKGSSQSRPQESDLPGIGYIIAKDGRFYVVTNAYAVRNAGLSMGDVIGVGPDMKQYSLKLIGTDNFYDIAILSMEELSISNVQPFRLFNEEPKTESQIYTFSNDLDKLHNTLSIMNGNLDQNYGEFLRISIGKWRNTDGPVINTDGAVIGMFSQYADAIFPDEIYRRYILSETIISKVIDEILQKKGNPTRCYTGIGFSTNNIGKVIIKSLVERSPAEVETDLIGHEVRSINSKKINSLYDVAEALRLVKPGESFNLVSDGGLTRAIETKELTYLDLERIASKAIETTGTIQFERILDNLIVHYKDEKPSKTDFILLAGQINPQSSWHNIVSASDFGQILRHIGLVGKGLLKVYSTIPSNQKNISIKYSKPILWN